MVDTVYAKVELQHSTNFEFLYKRKILWEISKISEISMLNVAKIPFLVVNKWKMAKFHEW